MSITISFENTPKFIKCPKCGKLTLVTDRVDIRERYFDKIDVVDCIGCGYKIPFVEENIILKGETFYGL